jgi:hypothetical protein
VNSKQAAESMRVTAKKLEAWAEAADSLTPEDLRRLQGTFRREAQRLRFDAAQLDPTAVTPNLRSPTSSSAHD